MINDVVITGLRPGTHSPLQKQNSVAIIDPLIVKPSQRPRPTPTYFTSTTAPKLVPPSSTMLLVEEVACQENTFLEEDHSNNNNIDQDEDENEHLSP